MISWYLAVLLVAAGALKIFDIFVSAVFLALRKPSSKRPSDWTPVYSVVSRLRDRFPALGLPIKLIFDLAFRAPLMTLAQSCLTWAFLGTAHRSSSDVSRTVVGLSADTLWIAVAGTAVACSSGSVLFGVLGTIKANNWRQVARASGHSLTRTGSERTAIDPAMTILVMTLALVASFAAADLALMHNSYNALSVRSDRFTVVDAIYFSVMTGATVGYGDIFPHEEAAKLAAVSEVLIAVTALGLLVSVLLGIASDARAGRYAVDEHATIEAARRVEAQNLPPTDPK
jgi:voltage-gated potassium channel Kch